MKKEKKRNLLIDNLSPARPYAGPHNHDWPEPESHTHIVEKTLKERVEDLEAQVAQLYARLQNLR